MSEQKSVYEEISGQSQENIGRIVAENYNRQLEKHGDLFLIQNPHIGYGNFQISPEGKALYEQAAEDLLKNSPEIYHKALTDIRTLIDIEAIKYGLEKVSEKSTQFIGSLNSSDYIGFVRDQRYGALVENSDIFPIEFLRKLNHHIEGINYEYSSQGYIIKVGLNGTSDYHGFFFIKINIPNREAKNPALNPERIMNLSFSSLDDSIHINHESEVYKLIDISEEENEQSRNVKEKWNALNKNMQHECIECSDEISDFINYELKKN